jgi:hypothetical protein
MKKIALIQVLFAFFALASCRTPIQTAILSIPRNQPSPVMPFVVEPQLSPESTGPSSGVAIFLDDPPLSIGLTNPPSSVAVASIVSALPAPIIPPVEPESDTALVSVNQSMPLVQAEPRFDFYRMNDKKDNELDLFVRIWDQSGTMIAVDGELNVKVWAYDTFTFTTGELLQNWEDRPVSKNSFVATMGMPVVVNYYDNFFPKNKEWVWVQAVFTSGSQTYAVEHPLMILNCG